MVHRKNSLAYMCKEKGLSWNTFQNRYYSYGWPLERALNEPPYTHRKQQQDRRKKLYGDYKTYTYSYKELAEKYNMSTAVVCSTLRQMKLKERKQNEKDIS